VLLADLVDTSAQVADSSGRLKKIELLAGCLRRLAQDEREIGVKESDRPVLNFCANNYLGLANHPDIVAFRDGWTKANPGAPVGRPNVFDFMAYGDMHVVAEGLRRAGRNLTSGTLSTALETLDKWQVSEAASPRTFTNWHHVGNLNLQMMIVKDGKWVPINWQPAKESTVLDEFRKK